MLALSLSSRHLVFVFAAFSEGNVPEGSSSWVIYCTVSPVFAVHFHSPRITIKEGEGV